MPRPFFRTLTFLEADEASSPLVTVLIASLLIGAGLAWMTLSETTVYAVSEQGRLLAAGAASPVQTPVVGLITDTQLHLGRRVTAGEILVSLDVSSEMLKRQEEEARIEGLSLAAQALDLIIAAEESLARANIEASSRRVASAVTRANFASEIAVLAKQQDEAIRRLQEASVISGLDAVRAAEDLVRKSGEATLQRAESDLASADLERARREARVRTLGLMKERTDLKARLAAAQVAIAELDWEIARRRLRAPLDGTVADVLALPKGAAVDANQVLANVVSDEPMRWVAYFPPSEAVGRIRAGQSARIRLDAFPWTAYGALHAVVRSVGSEPREQRIRVELDLAPGELNVPLSHGMTGTTDIVVEELSPLRLLLRLVGRSVQSDLGSNENETSPEQAVNR